MGIGGDMGLANKLKDLRAKSNYSLPQISQHIFKSVSAYRAYERGLSSPNPDTLKLLCKLFGVSPNELLEWEK